MGRGSPLSSADFLLGIEESWNFGGRPPVFSGYFLGGIVLSCWAGGRAPLLSFVVSELMVVGGRTVEGAVLQRFR